MLSDSDLVLAGSTEQLDHADEIQAAILKQQRKNEKEEKLGAKMKLLDSSSEVPLHENIIQAVHQHRSEGHSMDTLHSVLLEPLSGPESSDADVKAQMLKMVIRMEEMVQQNYAMRKEMVILQAQVDGKRAEEAALAAAAAAAGHSHRTMFDPFGHHTNKVHPGQPEPDP